MQGSAALAYERNDRLPLNSDVDIFDVAVVGGAGVGVAAGPPVSRLAVTEVV